MAHWTAQRGITAWECQPQVAAGNLDLSLPFHSTTMFVECDLDIGGE